MTTMIVEDKREPLVSVLMNCYNGEKYLREALDSVLAQTYQNWELIFWDNQSTDNSRAILEEYLPNERIRYFYAPIHTNLGGGRAAAWEYIRGDYLCVLDVDDYMLPNKVALQVQHLEENEDVGVSISNTLFFSDRFEEKLYSVPPRIDLGLQYLIRKYYVSLESTMISMKHARKLQEGFSSEYSHIADFDLIVRVCSISKISYLDAVLSGWRVHKNSGTWLESHRFNIEIIKWCDSRIELPEFKEVYDDISFRRKRAYFENLMFDASKLSFRELFKLNSASTSKLYLALGLMFLPFYNALSKYRTLRFQKKWW
ncbi:hypothetical protein DN730_10430 [Marinomonas piezotolerans]|uniref:Glycosyltransferase 2-like domain-containing protein n=1 Tax=Marinomonas piezotolerans TaxID=2213058 RepID=A0A370U8E4_9GAMM|nr:glycosyltransferase family 2 protein [Marinomonas piezotolerans]RDL44044.1 hypothetical protein DN730_10430 [Marinomonas piezotolerans]